MQNKWIYGALQKFGNTLGKVWFGQNQHESLFCDDFVLIRENTIYENVSNKKKIIQSSYL